VAINVNKKIIAKYPIRSESSCVERFFGHAVKTVIVFDRSFGVIITRLQKQFRDMLILGADGKYPMVVPVKIFIAVGITPADPLAFG
jgi:hypothetical protein